MSKKLRRLRFALQTAFGLAKRGYFIPYRYADQVPAPGEVPIYEAIADLFDAQREAMDQTLSWMEGVRDDLMGIGQQDQPPDPRWGQSWFPGLDAAAAYALFRKVQPLRLIEVGSGHSTRFFARAAKDGKFETHILAIDPAPRADLTSLGVQTLPKIVQDVDPRLFSSLSPGDVLFIDSSHILMPGSDVDYLISRVLPILPVGVYVHIHDIFLPFDYPEAWTWRGYNEQQAVAALLQGGAFRPIWSSRYMRASQTERISAGPLALLPISAESFETSLWLLKV